MPASRACRCGGDADAALLVCSTRSCGTSSDIRTSHNFLSAGSRRSCCHAARPQRQLPSDAGLFNRDDVKLALHAPLDVEWTECSNVNVFPNGDGSLPPVFTVLPNVIEKSERAVIVNGLADFVVIAEG